MKVSVRDGKPCEKILTIEVEAGEIQKEFGEFYRRAAIGARIPGFRPGKAPVEVVAMHARGQAREPVLKRLISESYGQAVREKSLEPLGLPEIRDIDFQDTKLTYRAHLEVRPKIKLSRAAGLSAAKQKPNVKPEDIEDALKQVQESLAQFKAVEDRPAALGDFLIADYICAAAGKEIEKRTDDLFELREEEYLKGFSPQLVGAKPGDEKEITVTFPADFHKKELAGKPGAFRVKVKEIKMKSLPALDDELAKEAGEFQSLAQLRAGIEGDLRAAREREAEAQYERALLDELVKHNKIDLPEGLVARRVQRLVEDSLHPLRLQGAPKEKLEGLEKKFRRDLAPEARRQVHLAFLLDEIVRKENLAVTNADLKAKYEHLAAEIRQGLEAIEKYYRGNDEARQSLTERIQNEKAIQWIKQKAKA